MVPSPYPRDMVGYGGAPPDPKWPNEARLAVNFVMNYHMRLTGHPSRAAGLERVLDYVLRLPDVWICRRQDIARHWIATHPHPATKPV